MGVGLPAISGGGATTTSPSTPLPSSVTAAAAKAPTMPKPVYSGPAINALPHVAESLGAQYRFNPINGIHTVNGIPVQPTSTTSGVPHAPVSQVAHAAGYYPNQIHQTPDGIQIMPHYGVITPATSQIRAFNTAPSPSAATSAPQTQTTPDGTVSIQPGASTPGTTTSSPTQGQPYLNDYWKGIQTQGGLWQTPLNGESASQFKQELAAKFGVDPNSIQIASSGHAFIPWSNISSYAQNVSKAGLSQQPQQAPDPLGQLQSMYGNFLGQVNSSVPQAPQLPQMPLFDYSQVQPFNFNYAQDAMNNYASLDPVYQQQMMSADQKINDMENNRGMYNSGIAQQAVNAQNSTLAQNEWNAVTKQVSADRSEQFKEYQSQVTNALNAYKANIDTLYKQGQLSDAQYADEIRIWQQQVSSAQNALNQMASMDKSLIPYTMGPTPYQTGQLNYDYYKTNLPYQMMTQYQQAQLSQDAWKTMLPYQQMTAYQTGQLGLDQAKLQAQIQQWAATDQLSQEKINISADSLAQKTAYDAQMAATAVANATNNQARTQLTGLHDSLVAIGNHITALQTAKQANQQIDENDLNQSIQQYNATLNEINSIVQSMGADSSSSGAYSSSPLSQDQLNSVASQAASLAGVPASWVGPLTRIAMHESSGDPSAVNGEGLDPTTGSVMQHGGEHATGLMQTLPSTFQEYALPGHTDINNPLDNMIAAIRYIQARYGGNVTEAMQKSLAGGY